MLFWLIIASLVCMASGYAAGVIDSKERLYRRYWKRPTETLDEIRTEARKRNL